MFVVTPLTVYWRQFVFRLTTTWVISSSAIVLVQKASKCLSETRVKIGQDPSVTCFQLNKGIPGLRDTQIPHRLQRSPCRNSLPRHSVPSHSCNEPQSSAYLHESQDCHRKSVFRRSQNFSGTNLR